jgi:acyl-CoA dehydrogenase
MSSSSSSTCAAIGNGLTVRPILNMVNHETNELFFDNLEIPAENLIGPEGKGFKYILDGLNAERTLIAAECIGDGYWFIDRARKYANERSGVRPPDRPEPGRAVPDRRGLHRGRGGQPDALEGLPLFDAHQPCGAEANMAKYLAAKASWEAANVCLQTTAASASPANTTSSASSARRGCTRWRRSRPT